ncbi:hypothetical protein OG875_12250 [Streptomyces sp. NBC_01498]|nr:hypothetical protein [Streptomyces sp. NBC_01498]WTL25289.1 hypothetical protein OG875_12250 [Streptomyces sp. NBC_01498]
MPNPRRPGRFLTAHHTHPVIVHGLFTCLSVTGLLLALTAAIAARA